jgi:hypothetical protein
MLAVLAWGLMRWADTGPDQFLAAYLAGYVETMPDELVEDELREMAVLDGPGLLVLLAALDSPRPAVARSATVVLDQQLATWREWPVQRASVQIQRLARGLAQRVDQWSPVPRSVARDLALQILDWPVDRRHVDRAVILADCEYVLRSALALPRSAALPPLQEGSSPDAVLSAPLSPGASVFTAAPYPDVAAASLRDELPEREQGELDSTVPVAGKSPPPATAEPRLLPADDGDRGVHQRIADEAGDDGAAPNPAASAIAGDSASAMTCETETMAQDAPASLVEPRPAGLPPELALMYDLNAPDARSAHAERVLRQSGFGDQELVWARQLVSPEITARRQLLDAVSQSPRSTTPWLIWLSHDADADVRGPAVARLVTSQAPQVTRRLLELECTESDPDIRRQVQAWRSGGGE